MHFSEEIRQAINSKRLESRIKTKEELQSVLRKRKYLNDSDNPNLENVYAKILQQRQICPRTTTIYSDIPTSSYYGSAASSGINESSVSSERSASNASSRNVSSSSSYVSSRNESSHNYHLVPEVTDLICKEIGSKWKSLARAIRLTDAEIDIINAEHPQLKEKVRKSLEVFEEKVPRNEWFTVLCNGLETARRKDLKRKIEEMGYSNGSTKPIYVI